ECARRDHACSNRGDRRQARKPDPIPATVAAGPRSAPSALPPPLGDAVRHRRRPPAGEAAAHYGPVMAATTTEERKTHSTSAHDFHFPIRPRSAGVTPQRTVRTI